MTMKTTDQKERKPDKPIYGRGIRIKPNIPGRTDTDHFKKIFLPELLPLEEYDQIVVLFSGGKDSTACFLRLLDLGVPKDKIELWHHDIDGGHPTRQMDWPCTREYVEAFARAFGVKLRISYRKNGFFGELYRDGLLEPVEWIDPDSGEIMRCRPTRTYMEYEKLKAENPDKLQEFLKTHSGRHMFPAKSADLSRRWCSCILKVSVGNGITTNLRETRQNCRLLILSGERREESAGRAKYNEMQFHATNAEKRSHRLVHHWRAVIDFSEQEVWDLIRKHRTLPHPVYRAGWPRCSCMCCIFSSPKLFAGIKELFPDKWNALKQDEINLNFTLDNKVDLETFVGDTPSCVNHSDQAAIQSILSGTFREKIFVDNWTYPAGAFHGSDGGSC